jgi:hypothetical protein
MSALRNWELLDDACGAVETSAKTPRFSHPYGAMNVHGTLGIMILIANSFTRWRRIFKGLSHDGGCEIC